MGLVKNHCEPMIDFRTEWMTINSQCNLCGRTFESDETLDSYKRMDHGQEGSQPPAGVG